MLREKMDQEVSEMSVGYCPDCDASIDVGNQPKKGQRVTCTGCNAYLEIVSLSPIELDWAYDSDDDDDDYEYEYEIEYDDEGFEEDDY